MRIPSSISFHTVIAGGGFAGVYAARTLAKALPPAERSGVALIADQNFMLFQPMLPEVAGSSLASRDVVNPIRQLCKGVTVLQAEIEDIDLNAKSLRVNSGHFTHTTQITFDHLVLALGGTVDLSRVPGMAEHAFLMKNVGDALELRATVIARFEEANFERDPDALKRLLTFAVVGGGFSGVETAGQLFDMVDEMVSMYPNLKRSDCRVVLIHSRDVLLPEVSESLGKYCEQNMTRRGIEVLLSKRVKSMTSNRVMLEDGTHIATHTVVSTVGNAAHPLVVRLAERAGLDFPKQRLTTDPDLRVKGRTDLWAAGDCAAVPMPDGKPSPPTAQFAMRQGMLLGKNLAHVRKGEPTKPFTFTGMGELAAIGHRAAVAEIMGLKFSGFIAWFLWRSIYLMKLPGLERKVRVMLDWSLDLFFPRDITLVRPKPTEVLQEMHLEAGDHVFDAGDPALSLYIVKTGVIDLQDDNGIVKSLSEGEHFGERALLDDKIWRFTAIARVASTLVALDARTFGAISGASRSIRNFFQRSSSQYESREAIQSLLQAMPAGVCDLTAGQLMTVDVASMTADMTIAGAFALMAKHPFNSFPMCDPDGKALGVVTQNAIYDALKSGRLTTTSTMDGIPVESIASVKRSTLISEAVERFQRSGRNKLLVTEDDGRLCGILTPIDLLSRPATEAANL